MACITKTFTIATTGHDELVDVTERVRAIVREAKVEDGQCLVYVPHATAAVAINENDDPNIAVDFVRAMKQVVKDHDGWLHDRVDDNAAAHIKAAIVGPSETIPIVRGELALGTWQNVFVVELDGPRRARTVIVSVLS